jgi:hypothetical protein
VIVDGRILMRDRKILTADVKETVAWAQAEAEAAFARVDISAYLEVPPGFWRAAVYPMNAGD